MASDAMEAVRRPLARLFRLGASRNVHGSQASAAGVSISAPGAVLLAALVEHGPLSSGDLARHADMDRGATSRQVKALEADGLVARGGRDGDGRVQVLEATSSGRRVRQRLADVQDRHMAEVLDSWSPGDREQFARLLERFVEDLRSVEYRPGLDHEHGPSA